MAKSLPAFNRKYLERRSRHKDNHGVQRDPAAVVVQAGAAHREVNSQWLES
jgi:hypothetical protein